MTSKGSRKSESRGARTPNEAKAVPAARVRTVGRIGVLRGWTLLRWSGRSSAITGLGMLSVVVLLCLVPVYSSFISNAQLQRVLTAASPTQTNVEVDASTLDVSGNRVDALSAHVASLGRTYLSGFAPTSATLLEGGEYQTFSAVNGQDIFAGHSYLAASYVDDFAFDYAQAFPHMRLIAGRLPQDTPPGAPVEVLVTPRAGLAPGDIVTISRIGYPFEPLAVRVVGIWFPRDQQDPYWNGRSYDTVAKSLLETSPLTYPLLYTRSGLLSTLAHFSPSPGVTVRRVFFTRQSALTLRTVQSVEDAIGVLRAQLDGQLLSTGEAQSVVVATALDELIGGLSLQSTIFAQPLYMVVAQDVLLALLFVAIATGLLIERQALAIATLQSRGASRLQMLLTFVVASVPVAAAAALVGPVLADVLAIALFRFTVPAASSLSDSYLLSAVPPFSVEGAALLGASLSIIALAFAVFQATRRDVLTFWQEQARQGRAPLWKRYYLDVGLAVLCGVGYLQLSMYGGFDTRTRPGQAFAGRLDVLLLVTPALLLLAGSLVVLRLFPLGVRLGFHLASRARGATGLLTFAQVSRVTSQFTRLALLLTAAIGLGLFALTAGASLSRNDADRAAYIAGGDLRLPLQDAYAGTPFAASLQARLAALPGVTGITPLYRTQARLPASQNSDTVDVLGIDPTTFGGVAWWRGDYADQPLSQLMRQLRLHAGNPQAGTEQSPIWAIISTSFAGTLDLVPGDVFVVQPKEGGAYNVTCVVGAVVHDIPTLYNTAEAGYLVIDQADYLAALANPALGNLSVSGPSEYWLRTTGQPADDRARARVFEPLLQYFSTITDRRALLRQMRDDPLQAGMANLLLAGAVVAVVLALLGSIAQSAVAVHRHATQFAVLRALGLGRLQLIAMLLGQLLIMYVFGLVGGILLGVVLSITTLRFLQFSSSLANVATRGVPFILPTFDPSGTMAFFAALLLACVATLTLAGWLALRGGLGSVLRLGEN